MLSRLVRLYVVKVPVYPVFPSEWSQNGTKFPEMSSACDRRACAVLLVFRRYWCCLLHTHFDRTYGIWRKCVLEIGAHIVDRAFDRHDALGILKRVGFVGGMGRKAE